MVRAAIRYEAGMIFDIKRFSTYDGPGIRTTVFLKRCPLHCLWCHNPEGISREPCLVFTPRKCIGCGNCVEVCPQHVHQFVNSQHVIDWERCQNCGICVEGCYSGALQLAGRQMTVDEVMDQVLQDLAFYKTSGGGITLSGGEPMAQYSFTRALLQAAKAEGLSTALDTTGFVPWHQLESLLNYVDLVLYDLKQMNRERHIALTGVPNDRILENLHRLDAIGQAIWIRLPLIPGKNDEDSNYHALGQALSALEHIERVEILRYHRMTEAKYESIGQSYSLKGLQMPTQAEAESRRQILLGYGLSQIVVR